MRSLVAASIVMFCGLVSSQQVALALSNQELFRQAGSLETQGQVEKAIAAYKQIEIGPVGSAGLSVNGQDSYPFRSKLRVARLRLMQGREKDADAIYSLALKVTPEQAKRDPELMVDMDDLAESYAAAAKCAKDGKAMLLRALELRKAIDIDHPRLRDSYRELATYLIGHWQFAEAERYIKVSIERQKQVVSPKKLTNLTADRVLLMGIYVMQKQWNKTEAMAKEMLVTTANQPTIGWCVPGLHYTLGRCYSEKKQFDLSDSEYRTAIELAQKYPGTAGALISDSAKGIEANKELRKRSLVSTARKKLK